MTDLAIAASSLRKSYGQKVVLDGIDLNVPAGTIFSLLGPNGAGRLARPRTPHARLSSSRPARMTVSRTCWGSSSSAAESAPSCRSTSTRPA